MCWRVIRGPTTQPVPWSPGQDLEAVDFRNPGADRGEARASCPHDYEYERNGTANIFMMFAPLEGWRHVKVTDRHAAVDYAHVLKELCDTHFPEVEKIILVQDNLSTHKPASLYEAFPAAEARRLVERFAWHYTPNRAAGWIWPNPNSACCRLNVSIAASRTSRP